MQRNENRILLLTMGMLIIIYILLRLLGFNSRFVWIDILIWSSLGYLTGYILFKKMIRTKILKYLALILILIIINLSLVLNGFLTHDNWMWDRFVKYREKMNDGNLVVLNGTDAGGLEYYKYSFRHELFWGAFFKEIDKQKIYNKKKSSCIIQLKSGRDNFVKVDICSDQIIK